MRRSRHHTRGFSLIEVLIALVVLAVGFAAVAKFQATVFEYSAGAKERAIAARLAEEKIADLRHYETLPATTGEIAYQDIRTNTVGTTEEISKVTYTRRWAVTNHYYSSTFGTPATESVPTPAPAYPDFKLATVTVGWTDQDDVVQNCGPDGLINCIVLSTIISASDPLYSGRILE